MNCKKCNAPIKEGTTFCSNCGEKITNEVETKVVETPQKKSKAPLIIGLVLGGVFIFIIIIVVIILVFAGILFGGKTSNDNGGNVINTPSKVEKTVVIDDYTFTIPSGFDRTEYNNKDYIGTNDFYFSVNESGTSVSTYEELEGTKYYIAIELSKEMESNLSYVGIEEETYSGQKYLIFRYKFEQSSVTYYYDVIYTKLYDDTVFVARIDLLPSSKKEGYEEFTKFIKSAKSNKTNSNNSTKTEDYTVAGSDKLGYLKLPGEWTTTRIAGADESSLQYIEKKTNTGSTATGSWIITLNLSSYSSAKTAADAEAAYYKEYDTDATNVKVESTKIGKYNAYKVYCQYKSDKVWVVNWYFEAEDGKVHIIQVEGLDLTKDYFKIPETFSLTKIN